MELFINAFFILLKDLWNKNHRNIENLTIKQNQTIISVYLFNYKLFHFTIKKSDVYVCLNCDAQKLLDQNRVPYIKMKSKTDTFPLRISIDNFNMVNEYAGFWLALFDEKYLKCSNNTYSCCSRWLECSNALTCVNPDKTDANACRYKRNLDKGLIFYGENSVLDNDGEVDEMKVKQNLSNMPHTKICTINIERGFKYEL